MANFTYQHHDEETDTIIDEIVSISDELLEKHPPVLFRGIGELPFLMRRLDETIATRAITEPEWLQMLDDQHYSDHTKV